MEIREQKGFWPGLEELRRQIVARQQKIRSSISQNEFIEDRVLDDSDKAGANSRLSVNAGLCEQDSLNLVKIKEAIARIDRGTFGDCLKCEESISLPRLQAVPFAVLCIRCQEEEERQSRVSAREIRLDDDPAEPKEELLGTGRKRKKAGTSQ